MHLFCSLLVLYLTMCEHLEMFLFHWHFTFFFSRHQRRSKRAEKKILSNAASGQNLGAQTGLQAKSTAETCYSGVCVRVCGEEAPWNETFVYRCVNISETPSRGRPRNLRLMCVSVFFLFCTLKELFIYRCANISNQNPSRGFCRHLQFR